MSNSSTHPELTARGNLLEPSSSLSKHLILENVESSDFHNFVQDRTRVESTNEFRDSRVLPLQNDSKTPLTTRIERNERQIGRYDNLSSVMQSPSGVGSQETTVTHSNVGSTRTTLLENSQNNPSRNEQNLGTSASSRVENIQKWDKNTSFAHENQVIGPGNAVLTENPTNPSLFNITRILRVGRKERYRRNEEQGLKKLKANDVASTLKILTKLQAPEAREYKTRLQHALFQHYCSQGLGYLTDKKPDVALQTLSKLPADEFISQKYREQLQDALLQYFATRGCEILEKDEMVPVATVISNLGLPQSEVYRQHVMAATLRRLRESYVAKAVEMMDQDDSATLSAIMSKIVGPESQVDRVKLQDDLFAQFYSRSLKYLGEGNLEKVLNMLPDYQDEGVLSYLKLLQDAIKQYFHSRIELGLLDAKYDDVKKYIQETKDLGFDFGDTFVLETKLAERMKHNAISTIKSSEMRRRVAQSSVGSNQDYMEPSVALPLLRQLYDFGYKHHADRVAQYLVGYCLKVASSHVRKRKAPWSAQFWIEFTDDLLRLLSDPLRQHATLKLEKISSLTINCMDTGQVPPVPASYKVNDRIWPRTLRMRSTVLWEIKQLYRHTICDMLPRLEKEYLRGVPATISYGGPSTKIPLTLEPGSYWGETQKKLLGSMSIESITLGTGAAENDPIQMKYIIISCHIAIRTITWPAAEKIRSLNGDRIEALGSEFQFLYYLSLAELAWLHDKDFDSALTQCRRAAVFDGSLESCIEGRRLDSEYFSSLIPPGYDFWRIYGVFGQILKHYAVRLQNGGTPRVKHIDRHILAKIVMASVHLDPKIAAGLIETLFFDNILTVWDENEAGNSMLAVPDGNEEISNFKFYPLEFQQFYAAIGRDDLLEVTLRRTTWITEPKRKDHRGMTTLYWAVKGLHGKAVEILLDPAHSIYHDELDPPLVRELNTQYSSTCLHILLATSSKKFIETPFRAILKIILDADHSFHFLDARDGFGRNAVHLLTSSLKKELSTLGISNLNILEIYLECYYIIFERLKSKDDVIGLRDAMDDYRNKAVEVTINQSIVEKYNRNPLLTLMLHKLKINYRLKNEGVIPDVIDEFSPSVFLQAEFTGGQEIQLGNTLKTKDTQDQPKVIITPGDASFESEDAKYTLCLTDPDAVSRDNPKWAEFCHWLVTDIKPRSGPLDIKDAKELVEYMGPAPPEETGKHRYVLLFFKNGKEKPKALEGRKKWGFEDKEPRIGARYYAKKYDLTLVGANFFFCQNEKQ
ncbi:hypothetical protein H072_5232 [Dactylellina haptotyla CBS 200.50]|uniref:Uncharacterized protein n=1 Tax=Dactylellina haptotyla (strain CBS 200.50) TaxID=1284197 RepID=S8AIC3_DACHA|nr:hypothetical protein H072_5232 [Dactylellina haptotyla CBS 200.50]